METKMKTELEFYQELQAATDEELKKARDGYKIDLFFSKKSVTICLFLIINHLLYIPLILWIFNSEWQSFTITMLVVTPLYVELFQHKKLDTAREQAINALRACKDIEDERKAKKKFSPTAENVKGAA